MTLFRTSGIPFLFAAIALAGCTSLSPEDIVVGPGEVANPAPVVEPDPPEVRLVSAIEEQGCVLTAANVETILLAASLTQAELAEITPRLADAGRVEVVGSGAIRVNTEACA
ncbi:hypothetical protein JQU17_04340 [Ponticoccus sp. SC2-23]|uniref:hypothetical protein n=1 Tax=Alexandriicola marinus TaxID=2081710 RepID=UPI000FD88B52|nr:hypothetical protein [Alexandriicola marinus]MBM1219415.1 hypothetical protein [Ponticoccus sp. SC6-9]MBM1223513.1 hypothetical protein [Ponticoccus sp. SC6-15]MBM1229228.1 hypothetical protein [Ponticoccus sp. SC6-38]MBM1232479.1 hypothetical protein [Ponticoccus sp. SC6-45]MBM1237571.1 hypothetical protein [Ponticoccus sp. SC6-49]MBM1241490.1 hypothetical protein [Ponticoccus sp. SC2-64]MBM1246003.1 hypothetical protein [Ponticoccus sp. SC6-42]MBM1250481.1 hypothetical protein [Pontico